jgi:hypothetical protein
MLSCRAEDVQVPSKHPAIPIDTSICSIVLAPAKYNHDIVRIHGYVWTDGIEHTNLVDPSCPGKAVALILVPGDSGSRFRELRQALAMRMDWRTDRTIDGIFLGEFVWSPKNRTARSIFVTEIANLRTNSSSDNGAPHVPPVTDLRSGTNRR